MRETDPTKRFSGLASDYVKYRPTYPDAVLPWLGWCEGMRIADIGAGTGIFTERLLAQACDVVAIEPNTEMREHLAKLRLAYPSLDVHGGSAESTELPPHSVDAVVAAQAFHWFDQAQFRAECMRIVRPRGEVALLWNDRNVDDSDFSRDYEALLLDLAPDYARVSHKWAASQGAIDAFFEGLTVTHAIFEHVQPLTEEGFFGRTRSASYVPKSDDATFAAFYDRLASIFERHARGGVVPMTYRCRIWRANLP